MYYQITMRINIKFVYLIGLFFFSGFMFSQNNSEQVTKKIHYYSFAGSASQEQIENLQQEVAKITFVTEAKVQYKPEKGLGELRVLTSEVPVKGENEPEFSPILLKKALATMGFEPNEYRSENQ